MAHGIEPSSKGARKRISLERSYSATPEQVWELWTTKDGIEEWWGPDGFFVTVHKLELWVGGLLEYAMTAKGPAQVEFMKRAGMPLTTEQRGTYTEVVKNQRLAFSLVADFIAGVEPYLVETTVEIVPTANGVRLLLTLDAMHDAHWTDMAVKGWENELGRLERSLSNRT